MPTISFTGSTGTGRAISAAGAPQVKRFGLELGGKTHIVLFNDADLVAELGGFTAAGERLHTAQPSLSHQTRDLEGYVGPHLFARTSRHVELTQAGRVFLDEARLTLAQAEWSVKRATQAAHDQARNLALGFVFGVEADLLMRVMNALHGEPPHIALTMHTESSPVLMSKLKDRKIDAVLICPSIHCQGLHLQTLRIERLIAAVPADQPLGQTAQDPSRAAGWRADHRRTREHAPVLKDAIHEFAERHAVALQPTYDAETLMMSLSLVNSVGGVCLLTERSSLMFPQGVVARPWSKPPCCWSWPWFGIRTTALRP